MATPTVIRRRPLPVRRVIGDLSDPDKVISWLDLPPVDAASVAEDVV
jgi:circadian clock protein KaiB